jgi:hypothetical protein
MNVKDWDTQVELARTAVEIAFQVADEMADRIEMLESKIAKAMAALQFFAALKSDFARAVLAELEGKDE